MSTPCICTPTYLDGNHFSQWVGTYFGICAYTWRDYGGIVATFTSILLWLILSVPQMYEIYELKSVEGVSLSMLLVWTFADTVGLIGLILTNQFDTLFWFSAYYAFGDFLCVFQWAYYQWIRPNTARGRRNPPPQTAPASSEDDITKDPKAILQSINRSDDIQLDDTLVISSSHSQLNIQEGPQQPTFISNRGSINTFSHMITIVLSISVFIQLVHSSSSSPSLLSNPTASLQHVIQSVSALPTTILDTLLNDPTPKSCIPQFKAKEWQVIAGRVLTFIASAGNTASRIPQVVHNYHRQYTEGLNVTFVVLQVFASFLFLVARFLPSTLHITRDWWFDVFPWCFSSASGVICAIIMWWQIYWYGNATIPAKRHQKYAKSIFDVIFFWLPLESSSSRRNQQEHGTGEIDQPYLDDDSIQQYNQIQ